MATAAEEEKDKNSGVKSLNLMSMKYKKNEQNTDVFTNI